VNHRYVPGVKYIAGVTFQTEYGTHEAGTIVEEAPGFWNLDSLVDNRFLWPYAPNDGYDWLPPHLFNSVKTMDEVRAALAGDPSATKPVEQFPDGEKPPVIQQAEAEAENQDIIHAALKAAADAPPKAPDEQTEEPRAIPRTAKKTAVKEK
jgi:hypothetical protein